jgi:hypothetical protein
MSRQKIPAAQPAPHSWAIESWPSHVYPHSPGKGRYLVRCNRTALLAAGALTRIGRDLVLLGSPYSRWLESQASRVDGFEIAPNRVPTEAAA